MSWILIALIVVSGFVKGTDIDVVGTFQSEAACLSASKQVKELYELKFDRTLTTLCLPTSLKENS